MLCICPLLKSCSSASLADTRQSASSGPRNGVLLFVCMIWCWGPELQTCRQVLPQHIMRLAPLAVADLRKDLASGGLS